MLEESLRNKTVKGTMWSAIDNVAQYAVSFIVGIILARLLSPDDYGLLGIVAIFTAICTAVINGGFNAALIRKKDASDDDYNTAFIVNLALSVFLYLVIFFCAPMIARFFHREELALLTRISSLGILIGALAMVQQTRLTKRIDFKTQTKITLIASIISGVIGITMAFLGCGVWSLVVQGLSVQLLRTVFLWIFNKWIPSLHFSKTSFHSLFGFGWKIMLSQLLDTIWKELTQVVIGRFYSPASLGQYSRAKTFSDMLSSNLTSVIQRVTYPVLSDIQDDTARMVAAYRKIIKTSMFVTAVSLFALAAISEPLLYCLIGPRWHEAAIYLPWICLTASLYPLHMLNLNMLQVQGRSDLFLILEIIKKIIGLFPLYIGIVYGIKPMLYTRILIGIVSYFLNSYYTGKHLNYSSWKQIKDVTPSYGVAAIVALSVWFLKFLPVSNWILLPVQIVVGVFVFFLVCKLTGIEEYKDIKGIVLPYLKRR